VEAEACAVLKVEQSTSLQCQKNNLGFMSPEIQ